ncbi:HAD family hydrolase [Azohydromonas caseinilytica]|uniref:HAD family phosphatase n=1 Tax=Azohydromonas caseinilytica TaxID=2728836 RepID=A0A848F4Y6_9BURK|nr:HAD family phosphatase [Azohydromonas caseinilytica]NML13433.1 HAD family phosphatase [Azohydromonas caseinilytica]
MRLIWDLGAVLLRWRPALLLRQVLPRHVTDEASATAWRRRFFVEGGEWGAFDRGDLDEPALAHRIARRTGLSEAEVQAVIVAVYEELQPLPESVALLQRFQKQGLRQHYFSNMPASYADHIERHHAFLQHFDGGLFSGRVKRMKPERGFYELAHERFGLEGQSVVFIDDHPENVQAARAFGWEAVLFRDAPQVAGELKALGLPA